MYLLKYFTRANKCIILNICKWLLKNANSECILLEKFKLLTFSALRRHRSLGLGHFVCFAFVFLVIKTQLPVAIEVVWGKKLQLSTAENNLFMMTLCHCKYKTVFTAECSSPGDY